MLLTLTLALTLTATSRMPQIWSTVLYRDIVRRRRCACVQLCMATPSWTGLAARTPLRSHPHPLVPCHRETHSRQPLQPLDPVGTMGSTAALQQLCSTQMDLCVRPSGHLTSPARRRVLSGPRTPTGPPRFYLFRGSTLLQYLAQGPVDAAARGKPHLTVFMHVCHDRHATLPCPALPCPTLRAHWLRPALQARLGSTGLVCSGSAWPG